MESEISNIEKIYRVRNSDDLNILSELLRLLAYRKQISMWKPELEKDAFPIFENVNEQIKKLLNL